MEERSYPHRGLQPVKILDLIHRMRTPDLLQAREAVNDKWLERLNRYCEDTSIFALDVAIWSGEELGRVGEALSQLASEPEYADDECIQASPDADGRADVPRVGPVLWRQDRSSGPRRW